MSAQSHVVSNDTVVSADSVVVAENFRSMTAEGRVVELDSLPTGRLTILVFFDPDCSNCRQALFGLKHSSLVNQLIEEQVLQVMTVHVGYEERLWRDMLGDMPETWVKTTTTVEMLDGKCYDLSSMPALYLLDADRKIMAKGYYAEQLTDILEHLW
jgi:hypothetical protein